jgi:hypothetical protein
MAARRAGHSLLLLLRRAEEFSPPVGKPDARIGLGLLGGRRRAGSYFHHGRRSIGFFPLAFCTAERLFVERVNSLLTYNLSESLTTSGFGGTFVQRGIDPMFDVLQINVALWGMLFCLVIEIAGWLQTVAF